MNTINARTNSRATLSLRYGATAKDDVPIAAMIPANELRRLVATMVD